VSSYLPAGYDATLAEDSPSAASGVHSVDQPQSDRLEVLDLFTGLGGFAVGFRDQGYAVTGVDKESVVEQVYTQQHLGKFVAADLATELVIRTVPVMVGGPPCRPWSVINQQKRGQEHAEHDLVRRFFAHVAEVLPEVFIMENVVALKGADTFRDEVESARGLGYSVETRVVRYSDYGAAMTRRRLFTVGVYKSKVGAVEFFSELERRQVMGPTTVRDAIGWTRELSAGAYRDHDWSKLSTIHKYEERYATGRYGWAQLSYDKPAPSFGSIAKTYILHPEAGKGTFPLRVLSVREAMCLAGFDKSFSFPDAVARTKRYHMVANSVNPIVARICASITARLINCGSGIR
jgi:DNA (cytosine-5)-methyltransferase 1